MSDKTKPLLPFVIFQRSFVGREKSIKALQESMKSDK